MNPNFKVVGEARHGIEALEKAIALKPHLITLDFSMPVMSGLVAAPCLRERLPEVCIIMLTMFSGEQMESSARKAGVQAVVAKQNTATHLIATARSLFAERPTPDGNSPAA